MKNSTTRLLAIGIAIIAISSGIIVLFLGSVRQNVPVIIVRVACAGDSITYGSGYPAELWMMLGADFEVENFGVGGSTVSMRSYKPYMYQHEFQRAKEYLPDIIIIMLGTNDVNPVNFQSTEGFASDYKKLVTEFQALSSKPKIWLAKPPPIFNEGFGSNSSKNLQAVIAGVERVASETGLQTIDVYSALSDHPEDFFADGIHPNKEGAKIIAIEVYREITSLNSDGGFAMAPITPLSTLPSQRMISKTDSFQ
jgi:lysophospholipase L1-like esterase